MSDIGNFPANFGQNLLGGWKSSALWRIAPENVIFARISSPIPAPTEPTRPEVSTANTTGFVVLSAIFAFYRGFGCIQTALRICRRDRRSAGDDYIRGGDYLQDLALTSRKSIFPLHFQLFTYKLV
ncbi:MAG: hypothetical protein KAR47_02855 [Planctomycetes bacterium]|nr:hypothetical protein [Planctomycetota bacterium]